MALVITSRSFVFRKLLFAFELQRIALGALNTFIAPATTAQCHITVVTTYLHLVAIGNDIALSIDASIDTCLATTGTCRFYLFYRIGNLKKATRAIKEM